ncbi:MAG: hypothetical protein FWF92_01180 [Oscillospiraceae bacterium]|nr:hypothetical protein [Oscillospiraceae bacterium]
MCFNNEGNNNFEPFNNGSNNCDRVIRQRFDCGRTQQIIRHQHIVRHQHDIINDYDVLHEHDYNYYDVVRERNVVRHNDHTNHEPNYCCDRNQNNNNGRRDGRCN